MDFQKWYLCAVEYYSAQKRNGAADLCGSVDEPEKRAEQEKPDAATCVYAVVLLLGSSSPDRTSLHCQQTGGS